MTETETIEADSQATEAGAKTKNRSLKRQWLKRGIAIGLGFLPLLLVEATLQLADWPVAWERDDPLIGFQEESQLFESDGEGHRRINPNRTEFFRPDEFLEEKPDDEFRIFCLGGSTVQGRPYQTETAFSTWLALTLSAADESKSWEVVNCGGVSYASYRLLPILKEVLQYKPDLIILCTGHNEFLEERTYAAVREIPAWQLTAHRLASHLKLYQAVRFALFQLLGNDSAEGKELLAGEVQARLDFENGLDLFQRDEFWRKMVMSHYAENLHRMIQLCEQDGVPLVLVNPCENLRDCAPFKSLPSDKGDGISLDELTAMVDEATELAKRDPEAAVEQLEQIVAEDPGFALSHYRLGRLQYELGEFALAKESLARARDEDICPLRMLGSMHDSLLRLAKRHAVPLVDAQALMEAQTPNGITDETMFLDHVHPSIEGHQLMAEELFETMRKEGWVEIRNSNWEAIRADSFAAHRESLGFAYFEHGRQRLNGLRYWTQGKAIGAFPRESHIDPKRAGASD